MGDQSDEAFLRGVVEEFGPPDVVVDDGSHLMAHVTASFRCLYRRMSRTGVYLVEDMRTAYWDEYGGDVGRSGSFIEIAKGLVDELNADHARGVVTPTEFTATTLSMHFYDSIVVFERGWHMRKHAPMTGGDG